MAKQSGSMVFPKEVSERENREIMGTKLPKKIQNNLPQK